jgi:hypothetical protein
LHQVQDCMCGCQYIRNIACSKTHCQAHHPEAAG